MIYLWALVPLLYLFVSTWGFWGEAPAMDPLLNYVDSIIFFSKGPEYFFTHRSPIHPPLLYSVDSLAFAMFGPNVVSYNLAGVACFAATAFFLLGVLKRVFTARMAVAVTLLYCCNPFTVSNAFYLTYETLIVLNLVASLYCYMRGWRIGFALSLIPAALNKETALIIPMAFVATPGLAAVKRLVVERPRPWRDVCKDLVKLALPLVPTVLVVGIWMQWIYTHGGVEWRDDGYFDKDSQKQNSFFAVLNNLSPLRLFSNFLLQNMRNYLVFNFQWVYTLAAGAGLYFGRQVLTDGPRRRVFEVLGWFTLLYVAGVLSYHTWTIPRYSLPCFVFPFLLIGMGLERITQRRWYVEALCVLLGITVVSNWVSIDPVTSLWGHFEGYGEKFYDISYMPNSPDRINYNRQFLIAVRKQNDLIRAAIANHTGKVAVPVPCFAWGDYAMGLRNGEKLPRVSDNNPYFPDLTSAIPFTCDRYEKR